MKTIALFASSLTLLACEPVSTGNGEAIATTATGTKLTAMCTDNTSYQVEFPDNDTAIITIDGNNVELTLEESASGSLYSNDHYEMHQKGSDFTLTKDGDAATTKTCALPLA